MRFEQLEYLIAVAESGSFSAAAQKLYVTQQAISISMKQLEEELGRPLFIKESNKTLLNEYGEQLLKFAEHTLEEKQRLVKQFETEDFQTKQRQIHIGSTSCVANLTLPSIIAEWNAKKKNDFFSISSVETMYSVLEQVKSGEKNIGLISINAEELKKQFVQFDAELNLEILAQDEIVVVMNRKNYTGYKEYLESEVYRSQLKTQFNIESVDKRSETAKVPFSASSNDVDFHRAMLEKSNASVTMSGLSYQYFFNSKKYIALCLEDVDVTILHVAVYRKDADDTIREIVQKIRKEMHMK
jgi:DNA-binding transcriptional LysR family regulator